jgi:drug/metabolite transporter (DMT)-like permease
MFIVKKHAYNPLKKTELSLCGAGFVDILGTMAFTFAVGLNPILTAPITSSYCIVTIILARIFLKEKLTKKQYLSLILVIIGIVFLGTAEVLRG